MKRRPNANLTRERTIQLRPQAVVLTIAGSDPSGGAGLQADLKTFQQLGVYGMSVVTLITVQNTQGVQRVESLSPDLVLAQLDAVLADFSPSVIKTGALGTAEIVRAVASRLRDVECPLVVDPVLVSKHGHALADDEVVEAYQKYLLPMALLVTPNRFEAERLTGVALDSEDGAQRAIYELEKLGTAHVLLKLGEMEGQRHHLLSLEKENRGIAVPQLESNNTHGTGCILSAAIAAGLARGTRSIEDAVLFGIHRVYEAISVNTQLGQGIHPAETRAMQRDEPAHH